MASELIIEDGSIVADADSYISLADARSYASKRGVSLSADDAEADIQLRKAFDYIESLRSRFKGEKTTLEQATQWPRKYVWVDCAELPDDSIPLLLQHAQVQYAAAINSGIDIAPTSDGSPFVIREKVGPIETEYSDKIVPSGMPTVRTAESLIAPLMEGYSYLTVGRA